MLKVHLKYCLVGQTSARFALSRLFQDVTFGMSQFPTIPYSSLLENGHLIFLVVNVEPAICHTNQHWREQRVLNYNRTKIQSNGYSCLAAAGARTGINGPRCVSCASDTPQSTAEREALLDCDLNWASR